MTFSLEKYTTDSTPNALMHITDYNSLSAFVERVLSMGDGCIPTLAQYEADRAFVTALVGFVFDVGDLFARPERLASGYSDYQFETVAALAQLDEPVLDSMFRQVATGEYYDKDAHEWVRSAFDKGKRNGIAITEWKLFAGFGHAARRASMVRCRKLLAHLAGEGLEEFTNALMSDAIDREIYYMGRFA